MPLAPRFLRMIGAAATLCGSMRALRHVVAWRWTMARERAVLAVRPHEERQHDELERDRQLVPAGEQHALRVGDRKEHQEGRLGREARDEEQRPSRAELHSARAPSVVHVARAGRAGVHARGRAALVAALRADLQPMTKRGGGTAKALHGPIEMLGPCRPSYTVKSRA